MRLIVGTDEAGYGPNLGPLVVATSVWAVPDEMEPAALGDGLAPAITGLPPRTPAEALRGPLVLADSKRLYKPGVGWQPLERGLWAALCSLGACPTRAPDCWEQFAPGTLTAAAQSCGFGRLADLTQVMLPIADIQAAAARFAAALTAADVRLLALQARVIFSHQFNELLDWYESKGALLSAQTVECLLAALSGCDAHNFAEVSSVHILSDKHGGRNRYHALLQHYFPEALIATRRESRESSDYHWSAEGRVWQATFATNSERWLPVALASMLAKYLREQAMAAFNDFWRGHLPDLVPTAGYPQDAKRFWQQTAALRAELGVSDRLIWRMR